MKLKYLVLVLIALCLTACGDRVGSEKWSADMMEKPKGEWTMEETGAYTKYCVLGMDDEKWCKDMEEKDKSDWTASEASDYTKNCLKDRED